MAPKPDAQIAAFPALRLANCAFNECSVHCVTPSAATQLASLGDSGGHLRPRLRVVTCCLVIRTAVTILLGISVATVRVVAVRLRLIYMLEHDRRGGVTFQLAAPEIRARPVPWPRRLDTVKAAKSFPGRRPDLKQFPAYLNRWDSQQARNEGVFAH